MESLYLAATHPDQRKAFDGHHSRQVTCGTDQHDRLTRLLLIKQLSSPWHLIDLSITFSIRRINYLLASYWQSRSSWVNMAADGVRNE